MNIVYEVDDDAQHQNVLIIWLFDDDEVEHDAIIINIHDDEGVDKCFIEIKNFQIQNVFGEIYCVLLFEADEPEVDTVSVVMIDAYEVILKYVLYYIQKRPGDDVDEVLVDEPLDFDALLDDVELHATDEVEVEHDENDVVIEMMFDEIEVFEFADTEVDEVEVDIIDDELELIDDDEVDDAV